MSRRLPPLNPLRAFEAAARHGAVTRAAGELNVTHSAVSHQVRVLEETLGVKLFDRRGRRLILTPAGQSYLATVQQALDLIADASARVLQPAPEGRLTIASPPAFATKWLIRRIGRFLEAYPRISLTIRPYQLRNRDLIDSSDVFIEYGNGHWERKWVRLLSQIEFFPVCSPRLLNKVPLRSPDDLRLHVLLHDDIGGNWARWLAAAGVDGIDPGSGLLLHNANLSLDSAVLGYGVALGDPVLAGEDLASGALIRPIQFSIPAMENYYVVCEYDRTTSPMVRVFLEWLLQQSGLRSPVGEAIEPGPPGVRTADGGSPNAL
jgi:LysR family glycine cleavage system transcriptional activator